MDLIKNFGTIEEIYKVFKRTQKVSKSGNKKGNYRTFEKWGKKKLNLVKCWRQ